MLTISAKHSDEKKSERDGYVRQEVVSGNFYRQIPVGLIDPNSVSAHVENGVLAVTLPAPTEPQPVKIAINSGAPRPDPTNLLEGPPPGGVRRSAFWCELQEGDLGLGASPGAPEHPQADGRDHRHPTELEGEEYPRYDRGRLRQQASVHQNGQRR